MVHPCFEKQTESRNFSISYQVGKPSTELPKAQKEARGPKASELTSHLMLYDKRFSAFHYPVTDEDAPNYRSIIQNPMDMATMLQRVDSGQYITCSGFLQDIDLIVTNAKVHGMLSQMDPALVTYCDKLLLKGLGTVTRTSARLRNVQPDVNLDQSYEALKWQKKNADATQAGYFTTTSRLGSNSFAHTM
ncbi:ATPase family AAA domain-containing protein [Populus alba x Populus x berolinensis]|nr:ATPase family AAA domain-containing protein [Populus alba x Populus x berolinensis]